MSALLLALPLVPTSRIYQFLQCHKNCKTSKFTHRAQGMFPHCLLSHSGILTILSPLETRDYMGSVGLRENFTPAPSSQPHTHWQLVTTQCNAFFQQVQLLFPFIEDDIKSFKIRHFTDIWDHGSCFKKHFLHITVYLQFSILWYKVIGIILVIANNWIEQIHKH